MRLFTGSTRGIGFWVIVSALTLLLAALLARVVWIAWRLTSPSAAEPLPEPAHRLSASRMGYLVLEGDKLSYLVGSLVLIGLVLGGAIIVARLARKRWSR